MCCFTGITFDKTRNTTIQKPLHSFLWSPTQPADSSQRMSTAP